MMKRSLLLLLLVSSGTALAQPTAGPTDIDLRAAYCQAMLKPMATDAQKASAQLRNDPRIPEASRKLLEDTSTELQEKLARLSSYVDLKVLRFVQEDDLAAMAAIKAAEDRGDHDVAALTQAAAGLDPLQALGKVSATPALKDIQERLIACRRLNWLPF